MHTLDTLDAADLAVLAELGWRPGEQGRLVRRLGADGPAVAD